jgi:hypothetical protein
MGAFYFETGENKTICPTKLTMAYTSTSCFSRCVIKSTQTNPPKIIMTLLEDLCASAENDQIVNTVPPNGDDQNGGGPTTGTANEIPE